MIRALIPALVVLFALPPAQCLARPRRAPSHGGCAARDKDEKKTTKKKKKKKAPKKKAPKKKKKAPKKKTTRKPRSSKKSARTSTAAARKRSAQAKRSAERKKRAAERREIRRMRRHCRSKKRRKTATCRRFAREEKRRAERRRVAKMEKKCAARRHKRSRACRRFQREQRDKSFRARYCGERRRRARKGDTIARFARRYKISTATFRRLNGPVRGHRLKAGKRYVIYRSPHAGRTLRGGQLLEAGGGVGAMQRPHRGWGTPLTVDAIATGAGRVQALWPNRAPLVVGDLSKQGGGCLPPHRSHRDGRDADIGYYVRGGVTPRWLGAVTAQTLDADRTWALLDVFLATGRLRYAFIDYQLQRPLYEAALRAGHTKASLRDVFQYPRPRSHAKTGIIRHLRGHADHIHVRFDCPTTGPCALPASVAATATPRIERRLAGVRHRRLEPGRAAAHADHTTSPPAAALRRGPRTRHAGRGRSTLGAPPRALP